MAQRQEPRRTDERRGCSARRNLQSPAAIPRHAGACIQPADADTEGKSEGVSKYIDVRISRAQQGQ